MRSTIVLLISAVLWCIVFSAAATTEGRGAIETRGKKKKIALFVYFADIVLKKIFVLKLIYAFVFWVVIHKAGYFLSWFVSSLKEKKQQHHEYYVPHQHYEYGPSFEPSYSYGPYKRKGHGHPSK